jgi:hypothetical protein
LFPAGHTLPAEFGPEPTEGSHKATRHAARGRQDQFLTMRYNTKYLRSIKKVFKK